jgi:enoyl-CoA hydratase
MKAQGAVQSITLNRAEIGNRLSDEMVASLAKMIETAAAEDGIKLIVLRGAGDDFCLGRDLAAFSHDAPLPEALHLRQRNEVIFDCYNAFRRSQVPVVAVVQGRALGFGCALAAVADVTIAADDASFQFPEMGHRILPGMAMSAVVDRMPTKALMYMFYSTAFVDAATALTFGLLSHVAPAQSLESSVSKFIETVIATPRPALVAVKEYARATRRMDVQSASDFARNLHATVNTSSEMRGT